MRKPANTRTDFPLTRWSANPILIGLAIGVLAGPLGLRVLEPSVVEDSALVEAVSEIALLFALFCVGLRLRAPFDWQLWRAPLRLSTLTMVATVILIAAIAHVLFDMSMTEAVLLGVVLTPTDAVLASDIHTPVEVDQDPVPFILAAEGAVTSTLAAPLLMITLTGLGMGDTGAEALGTHLLLTLWSLGGAIAAGWLIGAGMSRGLMMLETDRQGDFLEEMIVFATAVLTYICALAIRTDGLLAVFIAGLALSHGGKLRQSLRKSAPGPRALRLAGRVERFSAVVVMVLLGALLDGSGFHLRTVIFALVLLAVLRPLAVRLGLGRQSLPPLQRRQVEWFGARGAAALYCLGLAINHGLGGSSTQELASGTVLVIVTSIVFSAVAAFLAGRTSQGPGAVDL